MPEFHRNSPRVFSRRVAPAYRDGPGPSPSRSDSSRIPHEGPALFTLPFLGRAACISFVGRGFSRDIKNRLSQTFLSAAFSPSLRFGRAGSRYVPSPASKYGGVGRKRPQLLAPAPFLPGSGSHVEFAVTHSKQTTAPILPGSRIAYQAIAARSAT